MKKAKYNSKHGNQSIVLNISPTSVPAIQIIAKLICEKFASRAEQREECWTVDRIDSSSWDVYGIDAEEVEDVYRALVEKLKKAGVLVLN